MLTSIMSFKARVQAVVLPYIGGTAMLALVVAILLSRWEVPGTDFLQGMLLGFSIVGNLFSLWQSRKKGNI